jgi:replicative DNA helicase
MKTTLTSYTPHIDYNPDIERAVLGICTLEPAAFGSVYGLLTPDCFHLQAHAQVFAAMAQLWENGAPIDLLTLTHHMFSMGVDHISGDNTAYYLSRLGADVVNSAHLQYWCMLLRELAARRTMIRITTRGFAGDDVVQAAEQVQEQLRKAMEIRSTDDWLDASKAAISLTTHMDEVRNKNTIGISTTFPQIDKINGGFRPGNLVVVGARPSVGKSALMVSIAVSAAKQGYKTGIISLEMPAHDIFGRMVSSDSGVAFSDIDRNRLEEEAQRSYIYQSISRLATLPLWFSDTAQVNIHDIRAKAEKLKRRHGLDMLIIDYLQLIEETQSSNYRNREQTISQVSRGLKLLAMNLGIPVIALSQLNRESENRANKKPSMADLRESGAIEQDADIIMLLHRDWRCGISADAQGHSTEYQADLLIPKWRNGIPLDLKLKFEPHIMRFEEASLSY